MSEAANLKRDNTMEVTAQQGKEFLESQGMKVTDDDVKTRGQKELLDQIVSSTNDQDVQNDEANNGNEAENNGDNEAESNNVDQDAEAPTDNGDSGTADVPKMVRDGTMVVTAREGQALLEGEELEKTRAQTASTARSPVTSPGSKIKRTTTIAQTTQDSSNILGQEERGRTRSQTRKISESGEEEKKPAVKRATTIEQTIKASEDYLSNEAKRAKLDTNQDPIPEVEEPAAEEATAEA